MPSARHLHPEEEAIDNHINAIVLGIMKMYLEGKVADANRVWGLVMNKVELMNKWLGKDNAHPTSK